MNFGRYRPQPGDWRVWKRAGSSDEALEKETASRASSLRDSFGCATLIGAVLLLILGLIAGFVALFGDRPAPVTLMLVGHAPFLILLVVGMGRETPKSPEEGVEVAFYGYLTEQGLRAERGPIIVWSEIQRYEMGWASSESIRVRLHVSSVKTTLAQRVRQASVSLGLLLTIAVALASVFGAIVLATRLPGAQTALRAALCIAGVHLLLPLSFFVTVLVGKPSRPEGVELPPLDVLFDASQVSVDDLTARLDRYVARPDPADVNVGG
jgi:hypothetical protein